MVHDTSLLRHGDVALIKYSRQTNGQDQQLALEASARDFCGEFFPEYPFHRNFWRPLVMLMYCARLVSFNYVRRLRW